MCVVVSSRAFLSRGVPVPPRKIMRARALNYPTSIFAMAICRSESSPHTPWPLSGPYTQTKHYRDFQCSVSPQLWRKISMCKDQEALSGTPQVLFICPRTQSQKHLNQTRKLRRELNKPLIRLRHFSDRPGSCACRPRELCFGEAQ